MNRRDFLMALSSSALIPSERPSVPGKSSATPLASSPQRPSAQREDSRPNILMIMADQFRYDCVGANGNPAIHTPHLDRLAQEGVRFTNAYSTTPTCTPARTALMTGLGPWKHGMLGMTRMATRPYATEKAAALSEAGYYTVAIGKNHYTPITNPHGYHHLITDEHCNYSFHKTAARDQQSAEPRCDYESWFWSRLPDKDPHATGLGWNHQPSRPFVYPEELHATHWTGTTAVRFLEQYDRENPFFLKVSFIRPHSPYDPPKRLFDLYEDAALFAAHVGEWASRYEERSGPGDDLWHGKLPPEEVRKSRQGYYGSVTFVDEQIGRIMEALHARGLEDNTLVVFFSDHGDMLGDHNLWRKSYGYQASAHIPLILRMSHAQNTVSRNTVVGNPVEIRDLLPTFFETAGVTIPAHIEGRSLLGLLRTGGKSWSPWIDLEHNICYSPVNHWNGLTDGEWKYIFHAHSGEEQLFHLAGDPSELHDLAPEHKHSAILETWRKRLTEHLAQRGDEGCKTAG